MNIKSPNRTKAGDFSKSIKADDSSRQTTGCVTCHPEPVEGRLLIQKDLRTEVPGKLKK